MIELTSEHVTLLVVCGIVIVLDIASGLIAAIHDNNFSSTKMRKGLTHKFTYVIVIALALLLDYGENVLHFSNDVPIFTPVCCYIGASYVRVGLTQMTTKIYSGNKQKLLHISL